MGIWLAGILVVSVVSVLAFKALARRSHVRGREPQSLADMHSSIKDQVSQEVFNEVWLKIGEAFSIDPRLIRPSDLLRSLSNIDSWDLGEGEDALNLWLDQKHLGTPPPLETVLDLAKWVEASKPKSD
jgi:hypothetical protein